MSPDILTDWKRDVTALDMMLESEGVAENERIRQEDIAAGFKPELNPDMAGHIYTEDDIHRMAKEMGGRFNAQIEMMKVICPGCAEVFYVRRDDAGLR
jgi:hypothetical protein